MSGVETRSESCTMSFMGELNDIRVADLLYLLELRRQTGRLAISSNGEEVSLYLERGQLVLVTSSNASLRLGRMLIRLGILDEDRLREALQAQEQFARGQPLGRVLLSYDFVTEEQLSACVEEQCVEILARVISASDGIFAYHQESSAPPGTLIIPLNADRIVLEATRRSDELSTMRNLLPKEQAPLMLSDTIEEVAETLTDLEVYLAATMQPGPISIREIASMGLMDELELWRTVLSLRERGHIIVATSDDLSTVASTPTRPDR
jgi:hypothetical protein